MCRLRRGIILKGALRECSDRKSATNRFVLASVLCESDDVVSVIRRELRRVSGVRVPVETVVHALRNEVIKRQALESAEATEAERRYVRCAGTQAPRTPENTLDGDLGRPGVYELELSPIAGPDRG